MINRRTLFARLSAVALAPLVKMLSKPERQYAIGCDVAAGPCVTSIGPIRLPNHMNVFIDTTGDIYNWGRTYGPYSIRSVDGVITIETTRTEEA